MEFAIPGFNKRFCTPNALTTLLECLVDYASPETRRAGLAAIQAEVDKLGDDAMKRELRSRLERIEKKDERDVYF